MARRRLLTDTASSYGPLTRGWHWIVAVAVLAAAALGLWARLSAVRLSETEGAALPALVAETAAAFTWHKSLGLAVLVLALIRLVDRGPDSVRPGLIRGDRRGPAFLARTVQAALALSLVAVPLTGWLIHSAGDGFAPHALPLPQRLPYAPDGAAAAAAFTGAHRAALILLGMALALHVAGALSHHLRARDATLRRMLTGAVAPGSAEQPPRRLPWLVAVTLLCATLGAGALVGARPFAAPDTGRVAGGGGWRVTSGEIRLTVTQFGKEVQGRFPDWTARIDWDRTPGLGPRGHVTVEIDPSRVALGPLTVQALGPDFLDVREYPRAVFDARLSRVLDGQRADGTLTLRGVTRDVSFPFRLSVDAGKAYAGGEVTLDRRDFGIGANLPDPAVLAHEVRVRFTLEAERTE